MVPWKSLSGRQLASAMAVTLLCGLTAAVASQETAAASDKPVEWVGTIKVKTWQANTTDGSSAEYWHETTYTLAPDATFTNEATWSGTVHYSVKSYSLGEPCPGLQDWTFYDGTSSGDGVELDVTYSAPQGGYSLATGFTSIPVDIVNRRYNTCTGESTDSISGSSAPGPSPNGPAPGDENAMTLTGELNEGTAALGHSTQWNLRRVDCDEKLDTDGGGVGDCLEVDHGTDPTDPDDDLDADSDGDGVLDVTDNCPSTPNSDQTDLDGDRSGDVCDPDIDGDGLPNGTETATGLNPYNSDTDGDGDGDGGDNCPLVPNADQADSDGDGRGDACDESKRCKDNRPPAGLQVYATPLVWSHGQDAPGARVSLWYNATATDVDGHPLTWEWSFTDQTGAENRTGPSVEHFWNTSGTAETRTARVTATDACGASTSGSLQLWISGDPVRDFAPVMRLHRDEDLFPMSVDRFIAKSSLKYRGPLAAPQTLVRRGKVGQRKLAGGGYTVHMTTRRRNVTFASDDHVRPFDKDNAASSLRTHGGMYLDVSNKVRDGSRDGTWPTYVQQSGNKIVYWLFYGMSQPMFQGKTSLGKIKHEGDWERVIVELNDNDTPTRVGYVAHHDPVSFTGYPATLSSVPSRPSNRFAGTVGMAPVGYVSLRGHGTYPDAGTTCVGKLDVQVPMWYLSVIPPALLSAALSKPVCDYRDDLGATWQTRNLLVDVTSRTWFGEPADHRKCRRGRPMPKDSLVCGFGGGWGTAGQLPDTTGPLGPSAYKSATKN